jgi:hypothetical protein
LGVDLKRGDAVCGNSEYLQTALVSRNKAGNKRKEEWIMKKVLVILFAVLLVAAFAFARAPKDYQVTGPVLEVEGDHIVVQKGNDKWELAIDKDTKTTGDLKAGAKVEIKYIMKAVSIDVKPEPKKAEPKAEPKKK